MTLNDLDGRTAALKHVRDTIAGIEADLGGASNLTETQRQLIQRCAVLSAVAADTEARWAAGQEVDLGMYVTLTNALRRLYETVGLRRAARDTTLDLNTYIRERYGSEPEAAKGESQ